MGLCRLLPLPSPRSSRALAPSSLQHSSGVAPSEGVQRNKSHLSFTTPIRPRWKTSAGRRWLFRHNRPPTGAHGWLLGTALPLFLGTLPAAPSLQSWGTGSQGLGSLLLSPRWKGAKLENILGQGNSSGGRGVESAWVGPTGGSGQRTSDARGPRCRQGRRCSGQRDPEGQALGVPKQPGLGVPLWSGIPSCWLLLPVWGAISPLDLHWWSWASMPTPQVAVGKELPAHGWGGEACSLGPLDGSPPRIRALCM